MISKQFRLVVLKSISILVAIIFIGGQFGLANATSYSSTSFTIQDPVISGGGLDGSSTSFQVLSAVGQTGEGSGSSTSYELRSGVLYYPEFATPPVITAATAGTEQVTISWSAAAGNVAVDHYELGSATVSGAQTYSNVGAVLSTVASSLSGGTTYYFKIKAVDATGSVVAISSETSATPTAASGGDGGGGGGVVIPPPPPPDEGDNNDNPDQEPEEQEETVPDAPTAIKGDPLSATTMRWIFVDNSDNESDFVLKVNSENKLTINANASYIDEAVSPNTLISGRSIAARNNAGESQASGFSSVYSAIETPVNLIAQTFGVPNALQLRAVSSSNVFSNLSVGQSALEFVNTTKNTSSGWVKTDNIIVSGLAKGVPYTFIVRARNAEGRPTNYSQPFTFVLPTTQVPGQNLPNETDAKPQPDNADQVNLPLSIVSPENEKEIDSGEVEIIINTEPYSIVTLQVNLTTSTALADNNGDAKFKLYNLQDGQYILTTIASNQQGQRSLAKQSKFYIKNKSLITEGETIKPAEIVPIAPAVPPPPGIVQPPLTPAVIVSEIVQPEVRYECGWICKFAILIAILYVLLVLLTWYVAWGYINKPLPKSVQKGKRR